MTPDDALARVESMVQWDVDPTLTEDEVARLVLDARRPDAAGNGIANVATTAAYDVSTAYVAGDVVAAAGRWWRCIVAGTSATTAPTWPDITNYALTNTRVIETTGVEWVDNGGPWAGRYDFSAAAAAGWDLKASKAVGRFDFLADNQNFKRSQVYDHCVMMADRYRRRLVGTLTIG